MYRLERLDPAITQHWAWQGFVEDTGYELDSSEAKREDFRGLVDTNISSARRDVSLSSLTC